MATMISNFVRKTRTAFVLANETSRVLCLSNARTNSSFVGADAEGVNPQHPKILITGSLGQLGTGLAQVLR